MAAIHFEQVQRFILAKKIFCGWGHFKENKLIGAYFWTEQKAFSQLAFKKKITVVPVQNITAFIIK